MKQISANVQDWFRNTWKTIVRLFKARSISTQLIITISLIFLSFFALQSIFNVAFFCNFFTTQDFDRIHSDLIEYVENMNQDDIDYYDEMYRFTSENNAYSVIVGGQYRILTSSGTDYTFTIQDDTTLLSYTVLVPNNDFEYTEDLQLSVTIYPYNDEFYSADIIEVGSTILYNSEITCAEVDCTPVNGTITNVSKPNNLNYLFENNPIVRDEVARIVGGEIDLKDYEYTSGSVEGSWYRSSEASVDTLVFVHNLKTWNYIVTIVPVVNTNDVIDIVNSYNYYVYATAIVIIFIWSFRLSSIISKPIQNIELVARQIAQLNFDVEAHEYNNRENESLSNSINLIAKNLRTTLETLNRKNSELMSLYEDQSKQVSLKKQLVSSISHELKTPLMIMQVTIQGILDDIIPDEEQQKELLNVLDEINKSSMMIQDMLQIYRLDDANSQLEISEFDLSKTACFFVNDFENAIRQYKLELDINVQDEVFVEGDEKLIKRVISNFLTNAIKYTPIGGRMYLEVSERKDKVYFELTNYGTTIRTEEIEKIWMPFYRISREETNPIKTKGSGIGLYLVSEILKAHDAEFGISNVKNGVKAYFYMNKKQRV